MRRSRQWHTQRLVVFLLLIVNLLSPRGAQVVQTDACNEPAPALATLRRGENTADAEVVYPNCTVTKISATLSDGITTMDASNLNIQAVSSFPDVTTLLLSGNQITTIYDNSNATVKTLDLSSNGLVGLDDITIPFTVTRLVLDSNRIIRLDDGEIPDTVAALSLRKNGIVALTNIAFSKTLEVLNTSENTILDLSMWQMPSQLRVYSCKYCNVEKLSGVKWPSSGSLTLLDLEGSVVDSFEVANSIMPMIVGLKMLQVNVSDTSCSDSRSTRQEVHTVPICVLPDALYDSKYTSFASVDDASSSFGSPSDGIQPNGVNASSWKLVALISGSVLVLVLVGGTIGCLLFHYHRSYDKDWDYAANGRSSSWSAGDAGGSQNYFERTLNAAGMKHKHHFETEDQTMNIKRRETANTIDSSTRSMASISNRHLDNDIRTDQSMRHFRLMDEEVVRRGMIAKGGYGAVYKAKFRGKTVVLKQLLPDRASDPQMLNDFMDEIRTCSLLDHPKIVTFIGFTFTSLMDLSAVFEYMSHGDLATHLQKQLKRETRNPIARESFGWFRTPQSKREGCKCKSLVALDIAEALVYLHSFESPMIHRDLKPNNILLSKQWEAKLTDFGISRELREDQTMTAEIGTISWIAPEVLRGERYSEKADIYSFGVIMTELDTCRRPYSEGVLDGGSHGNNNKHTNARIAVLVSAGSIRPSLSPDCPDRVRQLVHKCLDGDPLNRPSALQLHYELRNLENAEDDDLVTMPAPENRRKSLRRTSYMQENQNTTKPNFVLIDDDDIVLLSNERRDCVQSYM